MKKHEHTIGYLPVQMVTICLLLFLLLTSCNQNNSSTLPVNSGEHTTKATISVHLGNIGVLSKKKTISLEQLILTLTCSGQDTIRDTTSISGSGENEVQVTIGNLKAPRTWTVNAATFDTNDSCIHTGTVTFVTIPEETAEVELSIDARFSMLQIQFEGINDSAAVLSVTVNGDMFEAETTFTAGSIDTLVLAYDYLPVGVENTVTLKAQGVQFGKDTLIYAASKTLNVVAGKDIVHSIMLGYVGPVEDPPEIINHPTSVTVNKGESVTFHVGVEEPNLSFQWRKDTENIEGATDSVYTISATTNEDHDAVYRCVVSDSVGQSNLSYGGRLTVIEFETPYLLDDFEDGDALNNLGHTWYYYDDNSGDGPGDRPQSAPATTPTVLNVPYSETERHAFGDVSDDLIIKVYTTQVEESGGNYYITAPFSLGDNWKASWCSEGEACAVPYFGINTMLAPTADGGIMYGNFPLVTSSTSNLAGVTKISFSIKSRVNILPQVTFQIQTKEIDEYAFKPGDERFGDEWGFYSYTFSVNPGDWQEVSINIDDLERPDWSHNFDFKIAECTHLGWQVVGEGLASITDTLDIDNVRFQ